ncbi:RING finger nhl-1 [Brachionus plicatilis]|uniref:RING finger nhl-1 n=1 Tax=Brachionus plicatilis TaxID=10195 RepID=A0A3M7R8I0_BRAPC|nr:RING finger nhl-1 [Brachionus plicatilis]
MGTKHSALYQDQNQNNGSERFRSNIPIDDAFNTQFMSQFDPFNTIRSGPNMVYNFNCLPPKPPRANAENTASNRAFHSSLENFSNSPQNQLSPKITEKRKPDRNSIKPSLASKLSLIQEILECPICYNLYENPHVLPCQHTFCKKCIISLQCNSLSKTIDCPICRERHLLPNGIENLTANYTMKKLIELESLASTEWEKEKNTNSKAKCFGCQKYANLTVCSDCSYMLCPECVSNPDHDYIIESKLKSKKYLNRYHRASMRQKQPEYAKRPELYYRNDDEASRLKLTLLCHSSAVEEAQEKDSDKKDQVLEDEFGKCKTFQKISISATDRVITLKRIVEKKFSIFTKDQILVYKDQILRNDLRPLSYYGLRQFSRIHIFDERDIKDSNDEEDIYGIYQDTNLINEAVNKSDNGEAKKNEVKNERGSKSSKSSTLSSQTDLSFDKASSRSVYSNEISYSTPFKRMGPKRSSIHYTTQRLPSKNCYSQYPLKSKYATLNYRKLDELFDKKINLKDY